MTQKPPFTKIFDGVATRKQMFELFNRIPDCPFEDRISGKTYENTWFEVDREGYDTMLEVLPPLFMRAGMFALISPVITSTLGRWVAKTKCIPTARAF